MEEKQATNLDEVWVNFDPFTPSEEGSSFIVYTVPIAIFFKHEAATILDIEEPQLLPCIKLFDRHNRQRFEPGFATMQTFVYKRMAQGLIKSSALTEAIRLSGGLMRDMARLLRLAADNALDDNRSQINLSDVQQASAELRNNFRRMLTSDDLALLRRVRDSRDCSTPNC